MCASAVMVGLYIQPEALSQWVPPTAQACLQPHRVLEVCAPPCRTTAFCCVHECQSRICASWHSCHLSNMMSVRSMHESCSRHIIKSEAYERYVSSG